MSENNPSSIDDNFSDYKPLFTNASALVEANRCLFCYDAPCTIACPTDIDVPKFIKKISSGNLRGSAKTILDANILGASCARICPTEELCEGACVLNDLHETPIKIGSLQRYATESVVIENTSKLLFQKAPSNGKKIALVGSGPASLGCAADLAKMGYECVCFDKNEKAGGLNTYAIADYKLSYETALKELEWIDQLGIEIKTNTTVGKDVSMETLLTDYDAVFLGIGLGGVGPIGIPGEELDGVMDCLDFIRDLKTHPKEDLSLKGKSVAVLGGGNTAIDAVTQACRLEADNVYLVYRRTRSKMGAYEHEQELALKDGGVFVLEKQPVEIKGEGKVSELICAKTKSENGKLIITDELSSLKVDLVLRATGQAKHTSFLESVGIELTKWNTPVVDGNQRTSHEKIWSGGDCVSGGQEVVNAVAEGKLAAKSIHSTLSGGQ